MNQSMPQPTLQKMILPKIGMTYGKGLTAENQYMIKEYLRIPTPTARLMKDVEREDDELHSWPFGSNHSRWHYSIRFRITDDEVYFRMGGQWQWPAFEWTHPPLLPALYCKPAVDDGNNFVAFDLDVETGEFMMDTAWVSWPGSTALLGKRYTRTELMRLERDPEYTRHEAARARGEYF
jgi:hypothetical protein